MGDGERYPAEDDGIQAQFEEINDLVTAKVEVNLRSLPSVEDPDCVVVASLKNGEVVTRTGISRDVGWSGWCWPDPLLRQQLSHGGAGCPGAKSPKQY